jgi:hypothetical protein
MKIKYRKELRLAEVVRGITPRRLGAARRALKREQDKFPLLAVLIAETQPTPEQRIKKSEELFIITFLKDRQRTAEKWREARKKLRELKKQDRDQLLTHWNRSHYPKTYVYLLTLIHRWGQGWRPQILTNADHINFEESRKKVDALLKQWGKEKKHVKKFFKRMLLDLGKEGLSIEQDRIDVFIEDPKTPGHADALQTEILKNKVFKLVPSGWGGFRCDDGGWLIQSRSRSLLGHF